MTTTQGFTLVELLMVIGITTLAVLFMVGISERVIGTQEFERVRETVRSELATAQGDTIAGASDAAWGVAFATNTVTRFQGATYATRNTAFDSTTIFGNSVLISGAPEIRFTRPEGLPTASATVTLTDGSRNASLTVNAAGAIDVR